MMEEKSANYVIEVSEYSLEELLLLKTLFDTPMWDKTTCDRWGCLECKYGHFCKNFYTIRGDILERIRSKMHIE